jgi:hypothetical protein
VNWQERIAKVLREKYPWLVADWNGVEYESMTKRVLRRLNAIEEHFKSIEERYSDLENRLNVHTNGDTRHRAPKQKEPEIES